jgi:nicotinamidase-related amidase
MSAPWAGVITAEDESRYERAGFGRPSGLGNRPALLIIDVQYRTLGNTSKPFDQALEDYTTAVGEEGWKAVGRISELLSYFRDNNLPVLYPHVAPKLPYDAGTLGAKVPSIMQVPEQGYRIPPELAPQAQDIMLPKKHPSAFFGTPLVSYLIDLGVDTLIVTGCSTSGCVRSTVVDAFAYNYKVVVPFDAVYDRSETVHKVNLFDMGQKYADVMSTAKSLEELSRVTSSEVS